MYYQWAINLMGPSYSMYSKGWTWNSRRQRSRGIIICCCCVENSSRTRQEPVQGHRTLLIRNTKYQMKLWYKNGICYFIACVVSCFYCVLMGGSKVVSIWNLQLDFENIDR